ncbi:(2Fe-2S)-binding protein [Variovorax paradoxus]|uniref:(2Fe-2S)-binding protein n=1 Tax=Variovorax paradoxus TaxID=34073 RepID=UPI001931C48E|nr:(2Fe-2S)-binding protein [Variovorax paradoxus]
MTSEYPVAFSLNGRARECNTPHRMLVADLLRTRLGLTGTHIGCEHGVCGACTIVVDGEPVRSCLMLGPQLDGTEVTTVEGLAHRSSGALTELQQAFRRHHALQCGFCTAGVLMSFSAFLDRERHPTQEQIREVLSGHLCRCTGYQGIVAAVMDAAERMRTGGGS